MRHPTPAPQCPCGEESPLPSSNPQDLTNLCRFVLLVSGLGLGGGGGESLLGTQLLVDVVTGQLGDEGEQCSAAHVSRVILAGNLLSHNTQSRDSINKVRSSPDYSAWPVSMTGPAAPGLPSEGMGVRVEFRTCAVSPCLPFSR